MLTLANRPTLALVVVVAALAGDQVAEATNGYLIHGIGTRAKALAGAGVALPQDALAAGTNPAGMAWMQKRYDVGLAFFNPRREYTVDGAPSQFPGTFGLVPGTVESDSEFFAVPNFGANWSLDSGVFGLSVYGQGGMNTDYPASTFFGSSPTGVDLSQLFVVPTYARSFGNHSLGVSPVLAYQRFEVRGVEAFGLFSSDPGRLSNRGHDESTGFGLKLGYLGRWSERFSFGVAFQSEIQMQEFDEYAGLFAEQGGFDIPGNLALGFALRLSPTATLALDWQEIYYSDVPSVAAPLLPNLGLAPLGADGGAGFGWQDMTVYKLGLLLEPEGSPWVWRFGFSTTDQPIPSSEVLFNILAPGVVEEHYTVGFTRVTGRGEISLALMHAPSVSVSGGSPLKVPGMQKITVEMQQWDLEVGYSWTF